MRKTIEVEYNASHLELTSLDHEVIRCCSCEAEVSADAATIDIVVRICCCGAELDANAATVDELEKNFFPGRRLWTPYTPVNDCIRFRIRS